MRDDHFEAQFTALKDQINPHFLFNCLSVLSSLVRKDPNLSEQFIDHLAKVYRYLLEQKDNELVTLQTELAFARSYTFLLAVRFAHKISFNLPPEPLPPTLRLLPFTVQILIENAIRHNRMSAAEPFELTIALVYGNTSPVLTVTNPYQPRTIPDGETRQRGHSRRGLITLRDRYVLQTGETIGVTMEGGLFRVSVPLVG